MDPIKEFSLESQNAADTIYIPERCCPNCRTADDLVRVIKQFRVETNPRYVRRDGNNDGVMDTYCNIFATDVALACGVVLPHWWRGKELNANALNNWLENEGKHFGWEDLGEARGSNVSAGLQAANQGRLVVLSWENIPGHPGHITVMLPQDLANPATEALIAQAGRNNFYGKPISAGFGKLVPHVFVHGSI
jgi:hypothetical protein